MFKILNCLTNRNNLVFFLYFGTPNWIENKISSAIKPNSNARRFINYYGLKLEDDNVI